MNMKEFNRYATNRIFVLAGVILLFGAIISALLWTTLVNFNQVHEASFEAVVTMEEARAEILRMQATLGRIMTVEDPVLRAELRSDIVEAEQKLYARFEALEQMTTSPSQVAEVIKLYNRWKLCRDAALASDYQTETFTECMRMVTAINEKIDVLTERQYRVSDRAYHEMLDNVQIGVIARMVLMVVLGFILMGMAWRFSKVSSHYISRINETQLLYDQAVSTMPDPLILMDEISSRILNANPAAVALYGYTLDELREMYNTDLSAEPDQTQEAVRSGVSQIPLRWHKRKDGSLFPIELRVSRFTWNGRVVHLAWIRDISDSVSHEQSLMDAVAAAQSGDRAKTSFLANISHEIRTPMNGLLGALQLLEQSLTDDDQVQLLHIGIDSAHSLVRLLENTLDYSQLEAGHMEIKREPFSVIQEVHTVTALFDPASRLQGVVLEAMMDEELLPCYLGDAFRVRQILINLISNALKFTEKGSVRVFAAPLKDAQGHSAGVTFAVEDTGYGIRPEDQAKIFQRFAQADHGPSMPNQGVGLGLAIVEELVSLMSGEIHVESVWKEGSRFIVILPLKPCGEERTSGQLTDTPGDKDRDSLQDRILLIEDDDISRYLVTRILEKRGYSVDAVSDSAGALTKLAAWSYRLILMDLQLPDKSGFDLTAEIRSVTESPNALTPIIALTAYDGLGIREKCREAGMQDYLPKPVLVEPLYAAVERWLSPETSES